jgi:hypothetical protein
MSIIIKTPNADAIFARFKQKANRKDLEDIYGVKKAAFNPDNVTAAEFVKNVQKEAVFYFESELSVKPSGKTETRRATYKDVEKVKFYDFPKSVKRSDWKGEVIVPMYKSLQNLKCETCKSTGKKACKHCNGTGYLKCTDCDGTGLKKCYKCDGKGKQFIEVDVYDESGKKSERKQVSIQCTSCFGSGKLTCDKCSGLTKNPCKTCGGLRFEPCEECLGTGNLWSYNIAPVPFQEEHGMNPVIIPSFKTNIQKEMGKDLEGLLEKVNGIVLKTDKDLSRKVIEPNLGYFQKSIEKALSETESEIKQESKTPGHQMKWPVYLFPMIILDCITPKGKKYTIYSIGSESAFLVFGSLP